MDLLRLVLCHQPLDRLLGLPQLLKQKPFILVRRAVTSTEGKGEGQDYIQQCTSRGELCRLSVLYSTCGLLRNRAVFLRDAKWYRFFRHYEEDEWDFWYAIESGIPEIQASVISKLVRRPPIQRVEALSNYNSLESIPWTPQLVGEISSLLSDISIRKLVPPHKLLYLCGYLGFPMKRCTKNGLDEHFYRNGFIDMTLKHQFTVGKNSVVESLYGKNTEALYSVLYLPEIKRLAVQHGSKFLEKTISRAVRIATGLLELYELYPEAFRLCLTKGIDWEKMSVTRVTILRVRNYLDNPEFLRLFEGSSLIEGYRIIAGYRVGAVRPETSGLRMFVGNFGMVPLVTPLNPGNRSVQQTILYTSPTLSTRHIGGRMVSLYGRQVESNKYWINGHRGDCVYQPVFITMYGSKEDSDLWRSSQNAAMFNVLSKYFGLIPKCDIEKTSREWDLVEMEVLTRLLGVKSNKK